MGNLSSDNCKNDLLLNPKYQYKHSHRICEYQTEELEISQDELRNIMKTQSKTFDSNYDPYSKILSMSSKKPIKIIIDTDIGTDIDDTLALLLLTRLKKSDVDCIGITTNYGPTLLRKYIAESILKQTKNNDNDLSKIPVIAGNTKLCGTHRPHFYAGNEGKGLGINKNKLNELWKNIDTEDAEDFIYKKLCQYPQQITIVSIGPATNIGNLIHKYGKNKIESLIGHIVVMGGGHIITQQFKQHKASFGTNSGNKRRMNLLSYNEPIFKLPINTKQAMEWITNSNNDNNNNVIHLFPNHNLSGDTLGSVIMFSLNCPISLIPHYITSQYILKGKPIDTLLALSKQQKKLDHINNENEICGLLLNQWFKVRKGQRFQCIHDVLTLYEAIYIEQHHDIEEKEGNDDKLEIGKSSLKYCNGTIICHEWAAFLTFIPHRNGPHRIAVKCINPTDWLKWCGNQLIHNSST